jgi:hypothetical protein
MDHKEVIIFVVAVGLAIAAIVGFFHAGQKATSEAEARRIRLAYGVGLLVGGLFGVGAALEFSWSWTVSISLGFGTSVIAPAIASATRKVIPSVVGRVVKTRRSDK